MIIPISLLMSILMSILMPVLIPILMFILSILLWFDRALLCKSPEERWRLWWLRVRVPISGLFKTTTTLTSEDVGWGMGKTYPSWTLVLKLKERNLLLTFITWQALYEPNPNEFFKIQFNLTQRHREEFVWSWPKNMVWFQTDVRKNPRVLFDC